MRIWCVGEETRERGCERGQYGCTSYDAEVRGCDIASETMRKVVGVASRAGLRWECNEIWAQINNPTSSRISRVLGYDHVDRLLQEVAP